MSNEVVVSNLNPVEVKTHTDLNDTEVGRYKVTLSFRTITDRNIWLEANELDYESRLAAAGK